MTPDIMLGEIKDDLLAIPAFIPVLVCPGYLAGWFTNLHGFRQRSIVERVFWSLPLSFAISPIATFLIARFTSIGCAAVTSLTAALVWLVVIVAEHAKWRGGGPKPLIGLRPLGGVGILLVTAWIALSLISLVDLQSGDRLFSGLQWIDLGTRLNWTQSVLHTGVPPANSLYMYKHAAPMRNYYFWYVICAAVVRSFGVAPRAAIVASCIWSGFGLGAIAGLYIKYFLKLGQRTRRSFILAICLFSATGLDLCASLWRVFIFHRSLPFDPEWWSDSPIFSWANTILWSPNHAAALVSGALALLLVWPSVDDPQTRIKARTAITACALSSVFGLSTFLALALFMVVLTWVLFDFRSRAMRCEIIPMICSSCALSLALLMPLLLQLAQSQSAMHGGHLLTFHVREIISPISLTEGSFVAGLATNHPFAARALADMFLIPLGYTLELGFCLVTIFIYLIPVLRRGVKLNPGQRVLLLISVATLLIMTFVRSGILRLDEFGFRAGVLIQFPTLLLATELLGNRDGAAEAVSRASNGRFRIARFVLCASICIGILGTAVQAFFYRFDLVFVSMKGPEFEASYSHGPYVLLRGFRELHAVIPPDSVVQTNPANLNYFKRAAYVAQIGYQTAITGDEPFCGSELGGDPAGCPVMASKLDSLYRSGSAEEARATCADFGIGYLIATVNDDVWKDNGSWAWKLQPVIADPEFRAIKCQ